VTASDHDLRERLLLAAQAQLIASADNDIATRAVCEAAGVSQPVLYRLFGDKQGLLSGLVEHGYRRYLARKAALEVTGDPVADLRAGWDDHMEFARTNAAVYQLMFAPSPAGPPAARREIFELLVATLERVAAAGRLTIAPPRAAQAILAANVGIALSAITQPDLYDDPGLSARVREAIFAVVLAGPPPGRPAGDPLAAAAVRLSAQLDLSDPAALAAEEKALLRRWLGRLSDAAEAPVSR
jgi:AcrR family transcriptional regulator